MNYPPASIDKLSKLSERQLQALEYDEQICKEMFIASNSTFLSADRYPLRNNTVVRFNCILCKKDCEKKWDNIVPKIDRLYVNALCKDCARKKGVEKKSNAKKDENKKTKEITKNIDESRERYCKKCNAVRPLNTFEIMKHKVPSKYCNIHDNKRNNGSTPKHTEQSISDLLQKGGSSLVQIKNKSKVGNITKHSIIVFKCVGYKKQCNNNGERTYTGFNELYCKTCKKASTSEKKSKASKGKKRKTVNLNQGAADKRRKYTVEDIRNMLYDQGAEYIEDQTIEDHISTKTYITFRCASENCLNVHKRQVRDFETDNERSGPYCSECANNNKSQKISIARTKILEPITDPINQKHCPCCKEIRDAKSDFYHNQNDNIMVKYCKYCRQKFRIKNMKDLQKRKASTCDDPSKQKCLACYRWRDKSEFEDGCITCKSICRAAGRRAYQYNIISCDKFNKENKEKKKCTRCWAINPVDNYTTEVNNIQGVVCKKCRDEIFRYRDNVVEYYLELKNCNGPCVDCGEEDIKYLEFDHIDRLEKEFCVSQAKSIMQLHTEAEKCVMRCGICHRRRTKQQLNYGVNPRPQKSYIDGIKQSIGKCTNCGWYDEELLEALEFDHIDKNTKSFNISEMVSRNMNIDLINEEISKCQLLCIHCHKLKTIKDNGYYLYLCDELNMKRKDVHEMLCNKKL